MTFRKYGLTLDPGARRNAPPPRGSRPLRFFVFLSFLLFRLAPLGGFALVTLVTLVAFRLTARAPSGQEPLRGSLSASLRSAALLSFCVVLCVFPHRAHRAHRAHYSHRAHCLRLPPRKAHGVVPSGLGSPLRGFFAVAGHSGGSRRSRGASPRLIRGRRFAAFFPRFARRSFFASLRSSVFRRAAGAALAPSTPVSRSDGGDAVGTSRAPARRTSSPVSGVFCRLAFSLD